MGPEIKIACVLHSLGMGGLENGVVNLLNHLPEDRFRFTLITLVDDLALFPRIRRGRIDHIQVGTRWGNDALLPLKLASALRRIGPDVVHTRNWPTIEGVLAARLARVPAVIHGEHGLNADEAVRMKTRRAAARRLLYHMADRVLTVSHSIRDRLIARTGVRRDKVITIPNGVDTSRFRPRRRATAVRHRLGVSRNDVLVGTVGRLDPVKDQGTLVRAFALLAPCRPSLRLVLIGDGPEAEGLRGLARTLGLADRTLFTGVRHDMPDLYPALDVFALPSLTEGMSNTLLEAMSCGVPCVATAVGGNPEIIRDGDTGRLVPKGDPQSLASALAALVDGRKLRRDLGRAARDSVVARFGLPAMASAYARLYESLVGRPRPNPAHQSDSSGALAERASLPPL